MFRKVVIALAATATLGAAALTPTTASAGWHGHRHIGPRFVVAFNHGYVDNCYFERRVVSTRYGWRERWVKVCYY